MPDALAYRRTHALLLVQRLLSFRPGVSPLTVILDSLEQSGRPVVRECIARARSNKVHVVFLAFETLEPPPGVDVFLPSRRKALPTLQKDITTAIGSSPATLLILDTLHPLLSLPSSPSLPSLLAALASHPGTSLLATYHVDCPLPSAAQSPANPYAPSPLTLLTHLATTLLTPSSLPHAHAAHVAARRSRAPPQHGLDQGRDGVLVGRGANGGGPALPDVPADVARGVVLEIEHRRRSGRGVRETVFVPAGTASAADTSCTPDKTPTSKIILLDTHPAFVPAALALPADAGDKGPESVAGTFSLSLTERQRAERAGVVLPYYDAQREGGEGMAGGGRILYQMGLEDAGDWDSEEDEL